MSDDTHEIVHDRNVISLTERYEVRDWANSLAVTETELREAVAAVGHSADKVREYLASQ